MTPESDGQHAAALQALANRIGDDRVITAADARADKGRASYRGGSDPAAIIRPKTREEVLVVMKWANENAVPLQPISRGWNMGWGDTAVFDGSHVLLDMSDINRVISIDDTLGIAVIEPGVSQGQLYEELVKRGDRWRVDMTSAGPRASVLGNAVARGLGHTVHGERFAFLSGLVVVLGDGTALRTGFGHLDGATTTHSYRWGVGPSLDGLFSQSNLGVVVEAGIWLYPRAEETFTLLHTFSEAQAPQFIDRLRALKQQGVVRDNVHIYPPYKLGESWWALGAALGSPQFAKAQVKEIKRQLKGVASTVALSSRSKSVLSWLSRVSEKIGLDLAVPGLQDPVRGRPGNDEVFLQSALGGTGREGRVEESPDPKDHGGGLFFLSPTLPMVGERAMTLVKLLREEMMRDGFFPRMSFNAVNGRALVTICRLPFDNTDDATAERAHACHDRLVSRLLEEGFPPHRLSTASMNAVVQTSPYWDVVRRLKNALDPNGIIAPGHYMPPAGASEDHGADY